MIDKELEKREIPNFFCYNGKQISNVQEWENVRKEIKELFLKEEYGFLPPKIKPEIKIEQQPIDFAGKANWESVYFTFEKNGKKHTVKTELILPKNKKQIPVFLCINFPQEIPNKYLPTEEIIDNGFGIFTFCYENVTSDNNDFSNGLAGLFYNENEKRSFGKIGLWSYMASICMDYLETREEVDKTKVAIIGHSRLGKTAILTSALDERFIFTCANESGCCGAALSRKKSEKNEKIRDIVKTFPQWFSVDFAQYVDNEESLPFDQHMLLSLIAPRYLMVGGAIEDVWADNEGQFLSCYLASNIWNLYGKDGLVLQENSMPKENDILDKGEVSFYLRSHSHFLSRYDWNVYMNKFKKIIGEKNET